MKRIRRMAFVLVCIVTVCALSQPVVSAADVESYNRGVAAGAKTLEEKYNITISYPFRADGFAAVGTVTLNLLDQTLEYLSPQLVRQISDFFQTQKGRRIAIEYVFPPSDFETNQGLQLASFAGQLSRLQIHIPRYNGQMLISGNSPSAIIHEFGHAFQEYIEHYHGVGNLKNQWIGFNGGYSYQSDRTFNPSETTFATPYASTDYYEDFAEAFTQAFTANRNGLGIRNRLVTADGARTGLGKKIAIIEALIPMYLSNTDSALQTIRKIYSTAASVTYKGITLSGNALEYIDFPEPNGVKAGVLRTLELQTASAEWHRDIGGWYLVTHSGEMYLAFSGGSCVRLPASAKAA